MENKISKILSNISVELESELDYNKLLLLAKKLDKEALLKFTN
jgi:hypothetical protein